MVDEIRKDLDASIDQIIRNFVDFDPDEELLLEAGFYAVEQKTAKVQGVVGGVHNVDALDDLLEECGIGAQEMSDIADFIDNTKNNKATPQDKISHLPEFVQNTVRDIVNDDVLGESPSLSMMAISLNIIDSSVKDALLAGRAGEKILQSLEKIARVDGDALNVRKHEVLRGSLYHYATVSRFVDIPLKDIGINPDYVKAAMAAQNLASLLEGGVKLKPEAKSYDHVRSAVSKLESVVVEIFGCASSELRRSGSDEAASKIDKIIEHLRKKDRILDSVGSDMDDIKRGFNELASSLEKDGILDENEYSNFSRLVENNIEEVKFLEGEQGEIS